MGNTRLKLNTRIGADFLVAVAILVAALAVSWFGVESAVREAKEARERLGTVVKVSSQLLLSLEQMENAEFLYLEGDPRTWAKHFDANAAEFGEALSDVRVLVHSAAGEARLTEINTRYRDFLVIDGRLRELVRVGRKGEAARVNIRESLRAAEGLRNEIRALRSQSFDRIQQAQARVEETMRTAEVLMLGAALIGILLGFLFWWRSSRIIVSPLAALGRATRAVAEGRFERLDHPAAPLTHEINELQADFNAMSARLEAMTADQARAKESLEAEVARRTAELEQARARLEAMVAELESVDKLKSDLMSVMSHELLTPVNFVTAYATTLEDGILGPLTDQQRRALRSINEGADRLARMVRNVLDYTRLEGGHGAILPELVQYSGLLRDALDSVAERAGDREIALALDMPEDLPGVWADPARSFKVLEELLDNAIKFCSERGTVTVRAWREGDAVMTEISDTGRGVPATQASSVFRPFYQGDSTSTREHGGMGLGLAIARRLVVAMGGSLMVARSRDGGAAFRFTLPVGEIQGFEHGVIGDRSRS
ncbi:MAG: HAMP domain-containing protein [Candidatus Sericytochromatia bacterium]|nr:HAMP domain-containing protein [Candidatus Tanganyikabacteria bacterium]